MKCTREEFEKKVWSKYPDCWLFVENYSIGPVYASHHSLTSSMSQGKKCSESFAIWEQDEVVKDRDGLFIQKATPAGQSGQNAVGESDGSITWTYPPGSLSAPIKIYVNGQEIELDGSEHSISVYEKSPEMTVTEPKAPICECGKEKHGFASHAQWCDIKE